MSEKETMIRLEGIKKRFRTKAGELEVLHGVSADIKKGEVFGIIGLSGAGKSTLVRCINLLERPTAGKVWLDGVELTALGDKELREQRRHMGMIFQQFHLLMQRTALDNVCFPMEISGVPKAKAKERAKELLELAGLVKLHHQNGILSGAAFRWAEAESCHCKSLGNRAEGAAL